MGPTTTTVDVALLAVVVGLMAMSWLIVHVSLEAVRTMQPVRPMLPEEDAPPAGLGRLVPVGAQVEQESRRGLVTLELWLASHRRRSDAAAADLPTRRLAHRERRQGKAAESG